MPGPDSTNQPATDGPDRPSEGVTGAAPQEQAGASPAREQGEAKLVIPSLDGLRAVAFFIVFLAHAGLSRYVPGYFGLSVFFFLSGYLITTLLRVEAARSGIINLKQFYLRRTMRIFPPMYVVFALTITVTLLGFVRGSVHASTVVLQALHLTNYYVIDHGWWEGIAPGTWVYWSLAIEEHFYLVFPLLYIWLARRVPDRSRQALFLVGICAFVLAWRCVLVFVFHAPKDRVYLASDTRIDSIIAGCVLAVWRNPVLDDDSFSDRTLKWLLPVGSAAVLVSLVITRHEEFEQTLRYTLQSFGLLPVFVACIKWHDRGIFRILNLRVTKYIGVLSYLLYLMHTGMLWVFSERTRLPEAVRGVLALGVSIALAAFLHVVVEEPALRLRRKLSRLIDRAAVPRDEIRPKPMAA
jgi:peptidoglycan/LPS O-acetylase OafA/YrhL